ncbi:type VII secretion protein EccCa [Micromonospora marina]|uniref:type VII secretion protein EccCa n=1 Tax=Micromonospora marina TaxID=307120 RepID=UPI0034557145
MSGVVISRPPRRPGPPPPTGSIELQEPPVLPEAQAADASALLTYLPMGLGSGATVLMFTGASAGPTTYVASGLMAVSTLGMLVAQLGRNAGERKRRLRGERRDYLRYLAQLRRQVRRAVHRQRESATWTRPAPAALLPIASGPRLWERRPGDEDFAEVRVALGEHRAALRLQPPQTKPVADLEPLCAHALRRFIRAYAVVSGIPTALNLRGFAEITIDGDASAGRGLLRATVAQLVTFHAPEDVRVAVLATPDRLSGWAWMRWLPHNGHPSAGDAAGPLRLFATDDTALLRLLGPGLLDRPRTGPASGGPYLVVVCDGVPLAPESPLRGGLSDVTLLTFAPAAEPVHPSVLRLAVTPDRVEVRQDGVDPVLLGRPDSLGPATAEAVARAMAPYRTAGAVDAARPLDADLDLTRVLGIADPRAFDPWAVWRARQRGQLRVPIGVGADGRVVELDIKESAQGGMGPHGMVIGATGSGKSELLRTLVIGLALTHSPEVLNLVLADFKGGATFLGMDALPHTSAVITNLAEELSLVDRMQDALRGELVRRQKVLRDTGHSSRLEHEKTRLGGAPLTPLPTLLIVVDEFSELLSTKPEFSELFVMIGRLGRSLGVHLLLASQRIDEGRIHQLESHLSYRIALRTFSASESRAVIGQPDAYHLPSTPGNGYLKGDTDTLVRFKASYVSGPCPPVRETAEESRSTARVVPFGLMATPEPERPTPAARRTSEAVASGESLLDVLVARLRGQGPPARQVWLPPLAAAPGLDGLLPGLLPTARRGLSAVGWPGTGVLRVPVGLVDRPFDQLRELLLVDLGGAAGNAAIVGGPQSGKSTLLRTLMLALALTHTPVEVQFYCLDFGGGSLAGLAGLPHVGSVAARHDADRVRRTVAELAGLLERRERRFAAAGLESVADYRRRRGDGGIDDGYGDVFLVVDGWQTVRQHFEELEDALGEIASRGLGYGLHLVVTANRWSEIRSSVRDLVGTRLELRLGDAFDSEVDSRAAAGVPAVPGRGLTSDAAHFLAALPRADAGSGTADLGEAVKSLADEIGLGWSGPSAPPIRLLPAGLPIDRLPAPRDELTVALGWEEQRLEPVWHDFVANPHLLVFGEDASGKTNALRLVVRAILRRFGPDQAKFVLADSRLGVYDEVPAEYRVGYASNPDALADLAGQATVTLQQRLPGPDITPERMRLHDWWSGPRLFVVVDDYDLFAGGMSGPMDPLLALLPHAAAIGLHLVVARNSSGAMRAMMDPLLRRMWELGTPGLLFSYSREEGVFLGEARPRQLPPGRAQLVTRRHVTLVQTGHVPARSTEGDPS